MKPFLIPATLMAGCLATAAHAVPIAAISELEISHGFVINGGDSPEGIDIDNLASTFDIATGATSAVDDPAATTTETSSFQVGNPFAEPTLPVLAQRSSATNLSGGFEGAVGQYDVEIEMEDDARDGNFDITRRETVQTGSAAALIVSNEAAASGSSFYNTSRDFQFTNTTDDLISFNIAGYFDADLRAEYTGFDGLARVAGGFGLIFSELEGAEITYFPVAPYLRSIEDDADGATVNEQLVANQGGITGLRFNASATAIGSGGTTLASFEGQHRYIFGISLEAGASVIMGTSFTQANSVEYTPQLSPVPLPASVILLLGALGGLFGLRRKAHTT